MSNENCQSVRDRLGAYATDALHASERSEIEAHLASCPECAAQAERLRRAAASLAPLRDEIAEHKLSAERRRQILEAGAGAKPPFPLHWLRLFAHRPALRWAAAAGIAALAGLAAVLWTSPSRDATQMAAREATKSKEKTESEIVAESETRQRMMEITEEIENEKAPASPKKQRSEPARRVREKLDDHSAAAIAQPQLADVVTAPSPFRERHVLLGVRATRPIDELSSAGKPFANEARAAKSEDVPASSAPRGTDGEAKKIAEPEAEQQAPSGDPETMPVRIRFNEQTVRSQRQIADRAQEDGRVRGGTKDFDAVYEVALEVRAEERREESDAVHGNNQLNVATLEANSPQRQSLTQQVTVAPQLQDSQSTAQLNRTAQAQPELYLDACENELERLTDTTEADSKDGEQPVLLRIQSILQAIAEVRPEDPRTQNILDRVNRQLAPAKPAAGPAKR